MEKIIILDNIRSAHNVGSIFRTADGAGVAKIYLLGYTPTPVDRFGRTQAEISKTSLGASESVGWEYFKKDDENVLFDKLKQEGFQVVAVEQANSSVNFYDFKPQNKVCYIFGNEIEGVSDTLLNQADVILEIPMKGKKESLNVSVTAGIVLFNK